MPSIRSRFLQAVLPVFVLSNLAAEPSIAQTQYTITDLGGLGGGYCKSINNHALNDKGEVLGVSTGSDGNTYLFLAASSGTPRQIAPLPGTVKQAANWVNNNSQVIGAAYDAANHYYGYLWSPQTGTKPVAVPTGYAYTYCASINNKGQIVGGAVTSDNTIGHAVFWDSNGTPRDMGMLPGDINSYAFDVNNKGEALGYSYDSFHNLHYLVWKYGGRPLPAPSLLRSGDILSSINGFNDADQFVGVSYDTSGYAHAVLYDSIHGLQELGVLPGDRHSYALSVNSRGQVFGISADVYLNAHYFIWSPATGIQPVNTGHPLVSVNGFNNYGGIAGTTFTSQGALCAFRYNTGVYSQVQVLGGDWSYGTSVNDKGEVAGRALDVTGSFHGFVWDANNGLKSVGDLANNFGASSVVSRNNIGQAVGYATAGGSNWHAVLWDPVTGLQNLGDLGGGISNANHINDQGQAVGFSVDGNYNEVAFVWDANNGMRSLGIPYGFIASLAFSSNNTGTVVGIAYDQTGMTHAWKWDSQNLYQDLGTLGGQYAQANAINDNGQIIGGSINSAGQMHAFLYANGAMQDLGVLSGDATSAAYAINLSGQIVGTSFDATNTPHPFLYNGGSMINLNSLIAQNSGWTLQYALSINSQGQITGTGLHNGQQHAYLLTPAGN